MIIPGVVASAGGGGGYHADAVHWDGNTKLQQNAVVWPNSRQCSVSMWVKFSSQGGQSSNLFDFDPANAETGLFLNSSGGISIHWDSVGAAHFNVFSLDNAILPDTGWHHIFAYADTNHAAHAKVGKIYIDGVDVTDIVSDTSAAFDMVFNGVAWAIPDNTDNTNLPFYIGDMADQWLAPGVLATDVTVFRDPITGKPKDPSGFPASAVLFSGNASTFPTNQGTGGAFTLTGSLTNASTSPSD